MQRGGRARVKVKICSASHLRAADPSIFGGKSDPYVKCQVIGRPYHKFQTKVVPRTLNPEWLDEEYIFEPVRRGDCLEFKVLDKDFGSGDDLLGTAILESSDFLPHGYDGDPLVLDDPKTPAGKATLSVTVEAEPLVAPGSNVTRCFVSIRGASDLRGADLTGKSDPYCKCGWKGEVGNGFKTRVVMKNLDPEWNEEDELPDFAPNKYIEFQVFDYDFIGKHDHLGTAILAPKDFLQGYHGEPLRLRDSNGDLTNSVLSVSVDILVPPPAPPKDELAGLVSASDTWPVPFQLRSLDRNETHRLAAYTRIGRSRTQLNPEVDLVLRHPGTEDISRFHAIIKTYRWPDSDSWEVRVYSAAPIGDRQTPLSSSTGFVSTKTLLEEVPPIGMGNGYGGGHAGGGTSADGVVRIVENPGTVFERVREAVEHQQAGSVAGLKIQPGSLIRFGVNELWVLERCTLFQRSNLATVACNKAANAEDAAEIRVLRVPNPACLHALRGCATWFDLMRVVLEWLGEPDEPPCVEAVEVQDELGSPVARHYAFTLEEQDTYDVKKILSDVNMGTSLKLTLSSDPFVLGPVLVYLEEHQRKTQSMYSNRDIIPD